jgi:hypothetical protein
LGLDAARKENGRSEKRDEDWNDGAPQQWFCYEEGSCNVDGANQTDQDGHSSRTYRQWQCSHGDSSSKRFKDYINSIP